jgi:hypothetical protein
MAATCTGLHLKDSIRCMPALNFFCLDDQEALLCDQEKREISEFTSEFSPAACLRLGLTFGLVRGMPIGTSLL